MKIIIFISTLILFASCSPKELGYEEGYIDVDEEVQIFYQKIGSGKQKIIIPLGFWLYNDFKHLANEDRTIVFYDMRNRHRSGFVNDTTAITIGKDIADLEKLRQHFGFETMSLIGESYLGLLVILYTMEYPQYIDRIVQIGAVPYDNTQQFPDSLRYIVSQVDTAAFNELNRLFREGYHQENPEEFSKRYWNVVERVNLVADTSFLDSLGPQWGGHLKYETEWFPNFRRHLRFHFPSIQRLERSKEKLMDINQPVLTIHGTHDRNAPYGGGMEWAKSLSNSRLITVKGAAHIPWIENPELVFNSIHTFLEGQWPDEAKVIE